MSAQPVSTQYMSVEEYLATEPFSPVKREYLAGIVYEMVDSDKGENANMAGTSEGHNVFAMNLYAMIHSRLRGKPCQPLGADMQLRLRRPSGFLYYYPDAIIACDPTDSPGQRWRERPAAIFEILSDFTRVTDEREKRLAYLELPSLQAYVRIEQDAAAITADVRTEDGEWKIEQFIGLDAVAVVPTLKMELPLAELYERMVFPA